MASTYTKENSPWIYIRYKNEAGVWKGKPTGYRKSNLGDQRQAELLARKQSEIEASRRTTADARFDQWVLPWIISKYGHNTGTTLEVYKRTWRNLSRFLEEFELTSAAQIRRDFIENYLGWRTKRVSRNMAIQEIKFMGMVIEESIPRGHRSDNPIRKPGLKKERTDGKELWTDEQIVTVAAHLAKTKCHWQQVSFYFGLYQACRLRQCQLPIKGIRFDLGTIQYPDLIVKGRQAYSQPIDARFLEILKELVATAKRQKLDTICKVPWDASLRWRVTLDRCGFEGISHHGLRATWITRAAEHKVSESEAMAFCHHSSAEVHRIYKKVSVTAIAHVSAGVPLPSFDRRPGRPAADDLPATRDSAADASSSRTRTRNRVRNRPVFARGERKETAQARPSAEG